jgi:Ca2+-binding RTX toxin-like protein
VTGGSAGDAITGSTATNVLQGQAGKDTIRGKDGTTGKDQLLCGSATDKFSADSSDVKQGCETKLS